MNQPAGLAGRTRGSILLPVIVVLLLIAAAATAMTLQARTSLREAALRRDRLRLGFMADGMARAAAQILGAAIAGQRAPPFALDGTPERCSMPGGGDIVLTAQDQGGLVDINNGRPELLLLVLQRAGLSGWDAKALTSAIQDRRGQNGASPQRRGVQQQPARPFASVDEIDQLPGMEPSQFDRLMPLFTVGSGSSTIDPTVTGPAIRAVIAAKELNGPTMMSMTGPSLRSSYIVTAVVASAKGMRATRRAALKIDPANSSAQFTGWDAPSSLEPLPLPSTGPFCAAMAAIFAVP